MLPFDRKPWAKAVASTVIILSFVAGTGLIYFFYRTETLHIPEIVGVFLLLLTIVPPNLAIVARKPGEADPINEHVLGDRLMHSRPSGQ